MAPQAPQHGESASAQSHRSGDKSATPDAPLHLEGIDLARVFASSAPTDERLAHILRCFLRKTGPQQPEQPGYGTGLLAEDIQLRGKDLSITRVKASNENWVHWTLLDPGVENLQIVSEESDETRVVERIRSMSPSAHLWPSPTLYGRLAPDNCVGGKFSGASLRRILPARWVWPAQQDDYHLEWTGQPSPTGEPRAECEGAI
jgi:hypothetical protein